MDVDANSYQERPVLVLFVTAKQWAMACAVGVNIESSKIRDFGMQHLTRHQCLDSTCADASPTLSLFLLPSPGPVVLVCSPFSSRHIQ